jgi:hypothetical protein
MLIINRLERMGKKEPGQNFIWADTCPDPVLSPPEDGGLRNNPGVPPGAAFPAGRREKPICSPADYKVLLIFKTGLL